LSFTSAVTVVINFPGCEAVAIANYLLTLWRSFLPQSSEYPKNSFDILLLEYPDEGEIDAVMIGDLLLTIQRRLLLVSSGETKKTNSIYPDDERIKFKQIFRN
jgi:hypothetical protein